MQDDALTTSVDDLITLLQSKGKMALKDASKELHVPESTLQLWVDFLVEERVLSVEYKFTKAYIYINNEEGANNLLHKNDAVDLNFFKEQFFSEARKNNVPEDQIMVQWRAQLAQVVAALQAHFSTEVSKRNLPHANLLYDAYKKRLSMM